MVGSIILQYTLWWAYKFVHYVIIYYGEIVNILLTCSDSTKQISLNMAWITAFRRRQMSWQWKHSLKLAKIQFDGELKPLYVTELLLFIE